MNNGALYSKNTLLNIFNKNYEIIVKRMILNGRGFFIFLKIELF